MDWLLWGTHVSDGNRGTVGAVFFVEASRVWNAELQAFLGRMPSMIEQGEFWIPPMLLFQFRRTMSFYRVKILEPIVSKIRSKHSHRNGNPPQRGRPSDIGLQELLSQAESAGVSASELAAQLVAHGLDGKPTGGRAMRMRRETKRLATALRRLKSSSARAVPVGTKPRKSDLGFVAGSGTRTVPMRPLQDNPSIGNTSSPEPASLRCCAGVSGRSLNSFAAALGQWCARHVALVVEGKRPGSVPIAAGHSARAGEPGWLFATSQADTLRDEGATGRSQGQP